MDIKEKGHTMKKTIHLSDLSEKQLLIRILRELKKPYKQFYSTEEAAKYLGIATSYLYKLNMNNEIAFHKTGKIVRYKKRDLDKYLSRGRVPSKHEILESL